MSALEVGHGDRWRRDSVFVPPRSALRSRCFPVRSCSNTLSSRDTPTHPGAAGRRGGMRSPSVPSVLHAGYDGYPMGAPRHWMVCAEHRDRKADLGGTISVPPARLSRDVQLIDIEHRNGVRPAIRLDCHDLNSGQLTCPACLWQYRFERA